MGEDIVGEEGGSLESRAAEDEARKLLALGTASSLCSSARSSPSGKFLTGQAISMAPSLNFPILLTVLNQ